MSYSYITKIENLRKHNNADRLLVGQCFGNEVIVDTSIKEGDVGVYFPTDTQLGVEYATRNNLLRKKDKEGKNIGGFLDEKKRNIRTLKLRGEFSDGLFMSLSSLESFVDISTLGLGDSVDMLNKVLIAEKYIPYKRVHMKNPQVKGKKVKVYSFPLFSEHKDTLQYAYHKDNIKEGDLITLSLKMHGTSARYSNTLIVKKASLFKRLLSKVGLAKSEIQYYGMVSGTRRTVVQEGRDGFHGDNTFRIKYQHLLENRLQKGETIYSEIVGFTTDGATIMNTVDNKSMDRKFIQEYGENTAFTYGCEYGESEMFVYRMTKTDEEGNVIEYPTSLIQQRCAEMNLKVVPVFEQLIFTTFEDLEKRIVKYYDGADPIGKTHIREGVVIRLENKKTFTAFKHKNISFKMLEGILKDEGLLDMEEIASLE